MPRSKIFGADGRPVLPTLFRDVAPSYLSRREWNRDSIRQLGCSEEVVLYLFPNPKTDGILNQPEDWFWTDRKWFKRATRAVQDEMYSVAGGCFSELTLVEQTALLEIPLVSVPGERSVSGKGKWSGRSGEALDIEAHALESILRDGERGLNWEGKAIDAIHVLTKKVFELEQGHWMGYETTNKRLYTPGPEYAAKVLTALQIVLEAPGSIHARTPYYFDKLFSISVDELVQYIAIVGIDFIAALMRHSYTHGLGFVTGHPDLTIKGDSVRLVEVKGMDRLHGSQAYWIRDFAKPLGFHISIVKVG